MRFFCSLILFVMSITDGYFCNSPAQDTITFRNEQVYDHQRSFTLPSTLSYQCLLVPFKTINEYTVELAYLIFCLPLILAASEIVASPYYVLVVLSLMSLLGNFCVQYGWATLRLDLRYRS